MNRPERLAADIAAHLAMRPQIKTVVTGGVVHARSYELVGAYAESVLTPVRLDLAFVGVNGTDPVVSATVNDERNAAVDTLIAGRTTRAVLVADSSTIGVVALGALDQFSALITDAGISAAQMAGFAEAGLEVIVT